ncbi:magnesium chelatase subunit H [Glacieibacterium sp.]|uniref:magnesium chelatase subunit H n=1 Tax=Glacieibacterium sp. TaxID=2860237 RepID=UPI003AFF9113
MRAEPASPATMVHVTIVTLDNHLSGAAERAAVKLAQDGIAIHFHAAADWSDEAEVERARADIARGDIVVATMLFLEDHIRAVMPALQARRETCDAMLGLMSDGDVVRLTKLGGYRMDAPARGPLALLKKLRGSSKPGASSGAGQMRMLKRLPKILRFIPGTAQDVRAYFLTLQYWLSGSDDNVVQMVRALVDRYAAGDRAALKGTLKPVAPREYPEVGVYHPALAGRMSEDAALLPAPAAPVATVGLLLLRSYVLGHDSAHYDGVIAAFEARGIKVVPAFASGLDSRPAIEAYFLKDGVASIDALVSLTGFSLVGGPAYNDSAAAAEMLAHLDVPYVAAHPLEFQTLQAWGAGKQGLLPLEATMMVAIPELDGATVPTIFGGRSDGSGTPCTGCGRGCTFPSGGLVREMRSCPERAEALAAKVAKLVALRRSDRAARKVAIVLFNFPPNAGATGTAAFLGVFESLFNTLGAMARAGYDVTLPASVDKLRDTLLKGNAERFGADANVHFRIPADDLVRREPHLAEIEAQWGPAPGRAQSDGRHVFILGAQFGNVFVGVQPAFGYEGDPMRLLFEGRYSPTHAFSAFYRWLREDFAADAVLHFGTHGALEFMPGKQTGLSAKCWPERLIGDLPNFYLYAANNPSEGTLAKRRSGATLISYMTPPVSAAGLYKGLVELKASLDRWRSTLPEAKDERFGLATLIAEQAAGLDLDGADIAALSAKVYELEETLIPFGLHVVGKTLGPVERAAMIAAMDHDGRDLVALDALLAGEYELDGIVRALDAHYVPPVVGGDVLRSPEIMPTGRNVHGFDPFRLPSSYAVIEGRAQASLLIARHMGGGAAFPESVGMVLWGTDNLKSEGAQLAQALSLMGARPRFDSYGRLAGAELVPLAELGRPRIDVVITLSGIFRDLLPLQTRMLAEAAWLATNADEPETLNFIRKHSLAHAAAQGCDLETAALRVFSNAEGSYGANVNLMIDGSTWTDADELADSFERQKGFAYGRSGAPVRQAALLKSALAGIELSYQNLESVELGITTVDQYVDALGGMSRAVTRARGTAAPVYICDATQGPAKVRTLNEQVALETRTRMLNPAWTESILANGFEGVRNIEAQLTTTLGWSATTDSVDPWVFQRISETYVLDDAMRARLASLNPKASARVASRLLEACERDLWRPDADTLSRLHAAHDDLEDRLEGVVAQAA